MLVGRKLLIYTASNRQLNMFVGSDFQSSYAVSMAVAELTLVHGIDLCNAMER